MTDVSETREELLATYNDLLVLQDQTDHVPLTTALDAVGAALAALRAAQPAEAPAGKVVRKALEHARARFQCLAEDFYETRDKTADWAMCCADAERMEQALAAVAPERGEK